VQVNIYLLIFSNYSCQQDYVGYGQWVAENTLYLFDIKLFLLNRKTNSLWPCWQNHRPCDHVVICNTASNQQ